MKGAGSHQDEQSAPAGESLAARCARVKARWDAKPIEESDGDAVDVAEEEENPGDFGYDLRTDLEVR